MSKIKEILDTRSHEDVISSPYYRLCLLIHLFSIELKSICSIDEFFPNNKNDTPEIQKSVSYFTITLNKRNPKYSTLDPYHKSFLAILSESNFDDIEDDFSRAWLENAKQLLLMYSKKDHNPIENYKTFENYVHKCFQAPFSLNELPKSILPECTLATNSFDRKLNAAIYLIYNNVPFHNLLLDTLSYLEIPVLPDITKLISLIHLTSPESMQNLKSYVNENEKYLKIIIGNWTILHAFFSHNERLQNIAVTIFKYSKKEAATYTNAILSSNGINDHALDVLRRSLEYSCILNFDIKKHNRMAPNKMRKEFLNLITSGNPIVHDTLKFCDKYKQEISKLSSEHLKLLYLSACISNPDRLLTNQ